MAESSPVRVLCIYRVKDGKEGEFRPLIEKHWPTLSSIGLRHFRARPLVSIQRQEGTKVFRRALRVEKTPRRPQTAHELPEVMAVWEPMGELVEDMEFLDLETLG